MPWQKAKKLVLVLATFSLVTVASIETKFEAIPN